MANYDSLLDLVAAVADKYADREALVIRRRVRKEKVLYGELRRWLTKAEVLMAQEKISPAAKVLIWGGNCPEYAVLLLSLWSLGRVAVPVDYRNSRETIEKIVERTKIKAAFVSKYFNFDFLLKRGIRVYYLEDFFWEAAGMVKEKDFKLLKSNKDYVDPERICQIIYTSGTTGTPKGVLIKQKNLLTNVGQILGVMPDLPRPRTVSILPLSHMFEQVAGLLLPLLLGTTIYYLPRINSFTMLAAFAEYQPTHLLFVPQLLKIIYEKIETQAAERGRLTQLKAMQKVSRYLPVGVRRMIFGSIYRMFGGKVEYIACGGAPLPVEISRHWWALGYPVIEGYGATEATAAATMNPIGAIRPGAVGKVIPGVDVAIARDGEIIISGPAVTAGYFDAPEKTKEVFGEDGYRTGDIGRFDKDGYLYITGRDAFKIVLPNGEKVYVEDIENKVLEDKRIKEVCVVGRKTSGGEEVFAYFILREGVKEDLEQVVLAINDNLESKQQIMGFERWKGEDFPRTPTLKIDRRGLINLANKKMTEEEVKPMTTSTYNDILDILAKVAGVEKARLEKTDRLTTDIGLDSLGRMELVAMAEEYLGLAIDETKITPKTTVADLTFLAGKGTVMGGLVLPVWQFTFWGEWLREVLDRWLIFPFHAFFIAIKSKEVKIPPGNIIIFNHPGVLDGVCILRYLAGRSKLKVVTNVSASFWEKKSIWRRFIEIAVGGIPLYESGQKLTKVLQTDADLLDRGYNLLFAPQGELQRGDEEAAFKPGLGYVVQMLDRPVTIVKIKGYREVWPAPERNLVKAGLKELLPKKRGLVELVVSKNIKEDWQGLSPVQVTNLLEEEYRKL